MDEIEDGFQLGPARKTGPAFLLGADHATSGRLQRLDLGIKVLVCCGGAGIADFGSGSVHYGCACSIYCSLRQNRPEVNGNLCVLVFIRYVYVGYTQDECKVAWPFEPYRL